MFVAVTPPEDVVEDLEEFLAPRREVSPFRWTLPEQFHLTLAFSAKVPERTYDDLVDRLERAARKRTPIGARITGGGAFPNPSRARVLFARVETDNEELRRMATGARAALAKAGAEGDGQRFRPHLTLARMGRPVEASNWVRLLDGYEGPSWRIGEIALVASHLGEGPRNRPRHEVVQSFGLGRAAG